MGRGGGGVVCPGEEIGASSCWEVYREVHIITQVTGTMHTKIKILPHWAVALATSGGNQGHDEVTQDPPPIGKVHANTSLASACLQISPEQ